MPSSPFHLSRASEFTDPTVYPPPIDVPMEEPESKKRKLDDGTVNGDATHSQLKGHVNEGARFCNHMVANTRLTAVYSIVKKECEELAESIVSSA